MIQRLQTLYLFLAALLVALLFIQPWAIVTTSESTVRFSIFGACLSGDNPVCLFPLWPLAVVTGLAALLSFVNIFLFRNRPLQMRVCRCTTVLIVALYLIGAIFLYTVCHSLEGGTLRLQSSLLEPIVALVFNIMAFRRIRADERLVRSADRLR